MPKPGEYTPHTQKSAAERAQDIEVSRGGLYSKDRWVPAEPPTKPSKS